MADEKIFVDLRNNIAVRGEKAMELFANCMHECICVRQMNPTEYIEFLKIKNEDLTT